ncbi:P-II family nitrogen regulator [Dissulfurimicrobium hydrothermale]|uniref:P-II family nitrogen regulator n=1 Tax=Dissulfurimicrobium hydrothermale TaxID=1750598 RepID=UPI001EDC0C2F|nr:P-II family nitrogen regulator [Dissulfurimicrobium hydrothermale]UKL13672.1 P-II family nitrogen regulator [Dissulfurimicrobium hydrothermale]
MKEVLAIIRPNRMNVTKQALVGAGIPSFTAAMVMGRGKRTLDKELVEAIYTGSVESDEMLPLIAKGPACMPKRMISMVVPDQMVSSVVKIITEINQTGSPGDGKIFVMPMLDVVRVRTGESGESAIDEMKGI